MTSDDTAQQSVLDNVQKRTMKRNEICTAIAGTEDQQRKGNGIHLNGSSEQLFLHSQNAAGKDRHDSNSSSSSRTCQLPPEKEICASTYTTILTYHHHRHRHNDDDANHDSSLSHEAGSHRVLFMNLMFLMFSTSSKGNTDVAGSDGRGGRNAHSSLRKDANIIIIYY